MDFTFPFPSLKQLCMVSIGQYLANERLSGFREFSCQASIDDFRNEGRHTMHLEFECFIKKLMIPIELKSELYVVLTGIHEQLKNWFGKNPSPTLPIPNVMELIFDVNGIFDESRTWQRHFEKTLEVVQVDKVTLTNLMEHVCYTKVLSHIDFLLRKILILDKPSLSMTLREPEKMVTDNELILVYEFNPSEEEESLNQFDFLNFLSVGHGTFIQVTQNDICIVFDIRRATNQLIKEFYHVVDPSERVSFIGNHLSARATFCETTGSIVDVLKLLDHGDVLNCLLYSNESNGLLVLKIFLVWPFTKFFIPLLTLLVERRMCLCYHYVLFSDIVDRIPNEPGFDCLYSNFLIEFFNIIPSNMRRQLVAILNGQVRVMQKLRAKNVALHFWISNAG